MPDSPVHKAAQDPNRLRHCDVCGQWVRLVPGGRGPVWVHSDTGAVVAPNPPSLPAGEEPAEPRRRDPERDGLLHVGDGRTLPADVGQFIVRMLNATGSETARQLMMKYQVDRPETEEERADRVADREWRVHSNCRANHDRLVAENAALRAQLSALEAGEKQS